MLKNNDRVDLKLRDLTKSEGISDRSLKVMDKSIANFDKGKVSAPVDLSDF